MNPVYQKFLWTLDSHDLFGPFFPAAGHSSYWWAHDFARMRGYTSYCILEADEVEDNAVVSGPITCGLTP